MKIFSKLNYKALFLALFTSCVMSKSAEEQCEELKEFVKKTEGRDDLILCSFDDNKIYSIDVIFYERDNSYPKELKPETIEKIFSYTEIESFGYEHNNSEITLKDFPINKLSNLKDLSIESGELGVYSEHENGEETDYIYQGNIAKGVIGSITKSIEHLTLNGISLSQDNINELSTLTNLKRITFENCGLYDSENDFSGFKKLDKVKDLKVVEDRSNGMNKNVMKMIAKFPSVEKVIMRGSLYPLKSIDKEAIKLLKDAKSLKMLSIDMGDKSIKELESTVCKYTGIETVADDDNRAIFKCSSSTTKISTNGKCGKEDGKCPSGKCCSKYGWCGKSDDYCKISRGCQSEFGECRSSSTTTPPNSSTIGSLPTSTNGRCGKKDGKCPSDECCSKYGYCGRSDDHCKASRGCQSEFGKCRISSTTTKTSTKKTTKTSTIGSLPTSTNGKCGEKDGKCPSNECCSKYGYCGRSDDHCKASRGCQSEFGKCKN